MKCLRNTNAFTEGETSSYFLNYDYVGTLAILEISEVTYLISDSTNDRLYIQGEAEHNRPVLPLMSGLPLPMTVLHSFDVRNAFAVAAKQASDQVKAAIKNGADPQDEVISWVITIGPYFIVKNFGPSNQAELDTRGHRPNPSGDAGVTEAIEETLEQNRIQILEPIYLIGTPAAATAVEEFLQNGRRLYISNSVIGEHLCDEYYYPYYDALNTCKTHVSFVFQLHYCAGPFSHIPGTVLFKKFRYTLVTVTT